MLSTAACRRSLQCTTGRPSCVALLGVSQRRWASSTGMPASVHTSNARLEQHHPMRWDQFSTPDSVARKKTLGANRMLAGPEPLQVRSDKIEAPLEPVAAATYDPDAAFIENEPHAWEKAIQRDEAAPADEFGRKNWHLHATKPDVNTNLFVQIIVDALEEARAEEICVIDVTNKHTYFPDQADYVFLSTAIYRRMDMMIWCTGKSAKHMETIAEAIMDRGKKGLLPVEYKKSRMKIDVTDDSTQWRIQMPCGKIMLDILSPDKRDLEMYERKYACLVTDHAGRFLEDMLLSQGWVRVWDYWTPNAPVLPKNDFESVYCKERAYGYERLDLLKPEYVVTDADLQRRRSHAPPATTPGDVATALADLKEPISPEKWEELRLQLTESKRMTEGNPFSIVGQEDQGPVDPDTNVTFQMDEAKLMSDEEMRVAIDRLRERASPQNIHVESPETRERKDREWQEYESRRDARIRKYGYYDYVELSNDMQRGRLVMPDGIHTWEPGAPPPDITITPHPENYRGRPKDTYWGPGWYDV